MDPRKFMYTSDYPQPLFVWKTTGSFNFTSSSSLPFPHHDITHGLPFLPLIVGQWDTNADFSTARDIQPNGYVGGAPYFEAYWDSSKIYMFHWNSEPCTYYYRLWAFAPPDYEGDLTPVSDGSRFIFSTDYNYLQLFKAGKVAYAADPGPIISHNLGYVPLAKVWRHYSVNFGTVDNPDTKICLAESYSRYHLGAGTFTGADKQVLTDKNDLYIGDTEEGTNAYYHIYTNEA